MTLHPILDNAQAVIFDKDGTLLDCHSTWIEATKEFGLRVAGGNQALAKELLLDRAFDWDSEQFLSGDGIAGDSMEQTAQNMELWLKARGLSTEYLPSAIRWNKQNSVIPYPLEGVPALIEELHLHGVKLGLATNDSEKNAHSHLQALQIHAYFQAILGYDSGYGSKPSASMIVGCCNVLGVSPDQVVMVGDTDRDSIAGKAAGCQAVVCVLNGSQESLSISQTSDLILEHTSDLQLS